jgi:hypothetical protein
MDVERFAMVALAVGAALCVGSAERIARADARLSSTAVAVDDMPSTRTEGLPLGILRLVVHDYKVRHQDLDCADLRHCDDLDLHGSAIDLDADGVKEWFVQDHGFSGTGAELDYVFKKGGDGRWRMIGRLEGLHLRAIGPKRTGGFLDFTGFVAGVCVSGRGKAVWNGREYVTRVGRVEPRRC